MFNFCSLYSGSTGNSLLVQSENTKILIDAGESAKKIDTSLQKIDVNPNNLDAILVTHEHQDHVKGLGTLSKKHDIPVFATSKTWDAMPDQGSKILDCNKNSFISGEKFEIGDLTIVPFSIPHDAADPCGFSIYHSNNKISVATDLGHMSNYILQNLEGSSFIMLEANYDPDVLRCSKYPYSLKMRIAGPNGHLPNYMAGKTISYLLKSGLKNVMLGHLSKENNFPELAYQTVMEELMQKSGDISALSLCVANRSDISKSIDIA